MFGAIAALTALAIAAIAISRQLRSTDEELRVLRALGAGPATPVADELVGVLAATLVGSLPAVATPPARFDDPFARADQELQTAPPAT